MTKVRRHVILLWFRTVLILLVAILAILSLYWGVLFRVEANLRSIIVHVVDFDANVAPYDSVEPVVGPAVVKMTQQLFESPTPCLGFTTVPASEYGNDPLQVREAVYKWDAWAAVIINPNATFLLRQAIETGNSTYDPTGAVQVVIQTARDSTTMQSNISPYLQKFTQEFGSMFGPMWGQMVMSNETISRENLARASAAVNPGVTPLLYDLRPFTPPTATPAVSIGLIYLIIMAFFSFSFFLPIHMKYIRPQGHPPLHFWQLIIWRWLATIAAYCLISLAYSIISLAFQIPFWPGPASHVYSPPPEGATAYALWLIFWVITNVSTSFYSLDLAPGFYGWGYAWPLHHVVEASRQLLFDLHSRIGLNAEKNMGRYVVNTEDGEKELEKEKGTKPPIRKRGFMRGV
ncbi:putative mnng and nitrosoguanidine resistance protein [Diaporthe ampelina]|uniref:Putative mnng and nitrosoguanidine resistance protein n=1 Tax=Diaporthe ampelina TaxID=1214573 RepID=A0A0G2FXB1_9PEZI|nr:putative mnng and nitrosoguanidine resistance protein [Diaporthe ampelina]